MRRLAMVLLAFAAVVGVAAKAGAAATPPAPTAPPVDVIEASGLLDPVVADWIERSIDRAEQDGAQALVIQMNLPDAVVDRQRVTRLAERIHGSKVPVTIWVGPSGARGGGLAGQLLGAAVVTGMAPGSRIGSFGPLIQPDGFTMSFGAATDELITGTMGAREAREKGVLKLGNDDRGTPTLGDFVVVLDGVTVNGQRLETAAVVEQDGQLRRQLVIEPRSYKLELLPRLMHTVASPPVAYLLLAIGLALLLFEFFTAGIGVAGVVGAVCVILGCYGVAVLPTRPWALAALVLAYLAFAVDVQTGLPRFWTAIGVVLFLAASLFLFEGLPLSWITLLAGIAMMLLFVLTGMPSMVRTRFATPTIGREWMVGERGEAVVAVDPDGIVLVRGAQWRARTNRATPVPAGGGIRVVAIDGVTLEIEPEEGGARDYREHRST